MAFAKIYSVQISLLTVELVEIEIDIAKGLHAFSIVGLANKSVSEAKDRISAAIKNCGFVSPKQKNQKVIISLAPAELKKDGGFFDLAMALGYLRSCGEITFDPTSKIFVGELALDGSIRPVRGVIKIIQWAKEHHFNEVYVPSENLLQASIISGISVYFVSHLKQIIDHFQRKNTLKCFFKKNNEEIFLHEQKNAERVPVHSEQTPPISVDSITGQETAKRALEIAAAGEHNIGMYGPPGTGKTLLAQAFRSLLPNLDIESSIETTSIYSLINPNQKLIFRPPWRAPHHSSSYASILGSAQRFGEITLAHNGVLFMDEFVEFDRKVLESLREPLENHHISIGRAKNTQILPARFTLIAALNPCPCGYLGDWSKKCRCKAHQIEHYRQKLSGPIIDRIDLWVEVSKPTKKELSLPVEKQVEKQMIKRIQSARLIQKERSKLHSISKTNGRLNHSQLFFLNLSPEAKEILFNASVKLNLSMRAQHKIIKIARTVADLALSRAISQEHILEALSYRPKGLLFE